jgi:diguanylate cyclase (GGDEF)-like protein
MVTKISERTTLRMLAIEDHRGFMEKLWAVLAKAGTPITEVPLQPGGAGELAEMIQGSPCDIALIGADFPIHEMENQLALLLRQPERPVVIVVGEEEHRRKALALLALGCEEFLTRKEALETGFPHLLIKAVERHRYVRSQGRLISEMERHETLLLQEKEALTHNLQLDPLTGIPNDTAFLKLMDKALQDQARTGAPLTLLKFGLEGLRVVNQRWGQPVGDHFLRTAAGLLRHHFDRRSCCRTAGAQFYGMRWMPLPEVEVEARRLFGHASETPFLHGGKPLPLRLVWIAIDTLAAPAVGSQELMRWADRQLEEYHSKMRSVA